MSSFEEFKEVFKNKGDTEKLRQAVLVHQPAEYLGSRVAAAIDLLTNWFKEQGYVFNLNFDNMELLNKQFDYGMSTGIALMADAKKGESVSVGRFIAYVSMELRLAKNLAEQLEHQLDFQKRAFIKNIEALENFIIELYENTATPEAIKDSINENFNEILVKNQED